MTNLQLQTLQRKDSTTDLFQRIHDIFQKAHLLEYLLTFVLLPHTILKRKKIEKTVFLQSTEVY